jgi:hypothetical protein
MPVALDSNRIRHFPSQRPQAGRSTRLYGLPAGAAGTGGAAPPRLPGEQQAQLSLKDKDKQGSAFPLTPRDRHSILAPRASPPFGAPIQLTWVLVDAMQIRTLCSEGRSCRDLAAVLADWPAWLAPISAQEVRGNVQVIS